MTAALLSQLWVEKLGWTLLHFLWQGTAIAAVYAMVRGALTRSLSAQGRYALASAALMVMTVAPVATFLLIPNASGSSLLTFPAAEWHRSLPGLLPGVVELWLLGVLAFSIRLLGGWRFAARLRSTAHPALTEWQQTLERIAARVGVRRRVRLLVSSLVEVPTVVGWLRPGILVPVEFLTGLPVEHITALLAHELAHILRHDYLASILQSVAEAVLFYHPAVWWISQQIRTERELCCDDLAVAASGDVLIYARALAELESRQPSRLTHGLAATGGSLANRIRRLIEPARDRANSGPGPGSAWAMILLCLAGAGMAAFHRAPARTPAPPIVNISVAKLSPQPANPVKARLVRLRSRETTTRNTDGEPESVNKVPAGDTRMNDSVQPPAELPQPPPAILAKTIDSELPIPVTAAAPELPPPAPTFRAATKLVQVDVIARSKGVPATGLTNEDFTLLDNGRPQKIALFSVSSSQIPGPASVPLPAGAVSNRLERDRGALENATVLLIDQKNTAQTDQAFAIQRMVKFLQTRRKPDRIGIYMFGVNGLEVVQEITDDAELLSRAAKSIKARDGMSRSAAMDTKHVLEAIARHLASVPGHKSLVWVTTSFPLVPPAGQQPDFDVRSLMDDAARALTDANVALYPVDARGLVGALSGMTAISNAESGGPQSPAQLALQMHAGGGFLAGTDTMTRLADLTGGLVLYNANGIEDSIQKALEDSELTYTLGFYPAQEEQDGVWHKLKVEVAKRGVRVRYREKYFASKTPDAANDRPTLAELFQGPLDATQLELVAETTPDQVRPGSWQVRTSVDLRDVHLENQNNTWSGAVDVSFYIEGSKTARTITRKVRIPNEQLAAALEKGIVVDDSIAVNGPAGELRVVAQDRATGAAGTVTVPLGRR